MRAGPSRGEESSRRSAWAALAAITLLTVFFHVFMEWLFFATKPSFLSALDTAEKLLLPGVASFPLMLAALLLLLVLSLPVWMGPGRRVEAVCRRLGRSVPALILGASLLLLVDNFIHTLFGWGSSALQEKARVLPILVFLVFGLGCYRWLGSWETVLGRRRGARRALYLGTLAVLVLSASAVLARMAGGETITAAIPARSSEVRGRWPNILLIGSDGVNAEHMSLYGYGRETTPFLDRLARESLVCENAFPNASATGASVVSMLTGRLATQTGVIFPPDIARGEAAYRHLPGFLRLRGYRTAQFSVRWYADAVDLNLQGSFDWANSRSTAPPEDDLVLDRLGQSSGYFLRLLRERLSDRLLFTVEARGRLDPFREVTENRVPGHRDDQRLSSLFSFITASDEPFFAHVHLMSTHGARFFPRRQVFSQGEAQDADWNVDFYDDAILDFDRYLQEVAGFLRRYSLFDDTILVVYSDHGQRYSVVDRVPLVIHFPGGAHAGRISTPVQNLDISATLLDALGAELPPWLAGTSLLRSGIDPCRTILSATHNDDIVESKQGWWYSVPRPPFYTLGAVSMITGERAYTLDLLSGHLESSRIRTADGKGRACPVPDPRKARTFLIDHLRTNGYKVSSLLKSM